MTDAEVAWSAGLYEGEGTIVTYNPRPHKGIEVRMIIAMTDREPLERWAELWGGNIGGPYRRPEHPNWAVYYRWQTGRWALVESIGIELRPWLSVRRQVQLDDVLAQFPEHLRGQSPRINGLLCPTEVIADKSGYRRHYYRGEKACPMCLQSYALWNRLNRKSRVTQSTGATS